MIIIKHRHFSKSLFFYMFSLISAMQGNLPRQTSDTSLILCIFIFEFPTLFRGEFL